MASSTTTNHAAAWLFVGAILVGGVTAAYLYTRAPDPSATEEVAAIAQDSAADSENKATPQAGDGSSQAASEDKGTQTAAVADAAPPRFDILRVEQDGSAVIAGTAPVGSMVVLMANGEKIASGTAGSGGDFAIVLDEPLAKGDHELTLHATDSTGKSVTSTETGVVSVPEEGGELLAMVTEQGKASRVMQAPAGDGGQAESPATKTPATEMAAEEKPAEEKQMETASLDQGEESAAKIEAAPSQDKQIEQSVQSQGAEIVPVLVQAVDVEDGRMFIAGTGAPNRDVNIYLDGDYLGTTKVTAGGTYLLEAAKALESGTYTIRADMLAESGGAVDRRASVELQHQVEMQTAMQESVGEKAAEFMAKAKSGIVAAEEAVEEKAAEIMKSAEATAEAVEEKAAEVMESAKTGTVAAEEAVEEKATEVMKSAEATAQAVEEKAAQSMQTAEAVTEAAEEKAAATMKADEAEIVAVEEAVEEKVAETMEAAEAEAVAIEEAVEEKAAETMEMAKEATEITEEKAAEVMETVEAVVETVEEKASEMTGSAKTDSESMSADKMDKPADTSEQAPSQGAATLAERMEQKPEEAESMEMAKSQDQTEQVASADPAQTRVIKSGASVIIRRGDNLWRISRRMLGRGIQYTVIYEANRDQIQDPDLIFPGQVFDVPGGEESEQG
ncbi:MAG: Ig-like domain-containing protein [Rhizobiaceae bacterium]